ncbi:MAG TPA: hypothetical protein PKM78_08085 [Anaerolineae bacterium]|nr:hypothetical protein [Anaerolineae bacterium]HNU03783.1 hypothetical protein [Anaerolineae bacterium]
MRSKPIVGAAGILILASLLIALVAVGVPVAEGREARQVLQTALAQIETPEPGQIVHLSYTLYHRGPPAGLEPGDLYHLPYEEIWPARQIEDTWLEIDAQGETVRWRTQLRSEAGELLQDLMFDHGVETDYSPQEDKAYRYAMQASPFRDERVALIEDFLEQEGLSRRQALAPDGRSVISVYTKAIDLDGATWVSQGIEAALLSFSRPFVADLQPRSQATRLDFDPASFAPIGEARVVWDRAGAEHVVSYRTLSEPDFVSDRAAQADTVFRQEIPEHAFQDSFSAPPGTRYLTALDQIVRHVDHPLYVLDDSTAPLQLVAASLTIPDSSHPGPGFLQDIEFAAALGVGVQTIYVSEDDTARLTVVQGPLGPMRDTLRQTRPTWTQAERIQIGLGDNQVVAWELIGLDPDQVRYVIEAGDTILHLNGQGMAAEQIQKLLQNFALAR